MQNRSVVSLILLSFVTCGFYALYVATAMYVETNRELGIEKSVGINFTIAFFTCGIWLVIMMYTTAQNHVIIARNKGIIISDNSIIYFILSFFFSFIVICLLQNQQNGLIDNQNNFDKTTF